jgi:hypothetical protein
MTILKINIPKRNVELGEKKQSWFHFILKSVFCFIRKEEVK